MAQYGIFTKPISFTKEGRMTKEEMKKLAVIITAGGPGGRFENCCGNIHKSMAPVGPKKRPHLEYQVDYLLKNGVTKIIIVAGHLSQMIEDVFISYRKRGVEIILDPPERPETGGAIRNAVKYILQDPSRLIADVMYCNPDTLVMGLDPARLYAFHLTHQLPATLMLTTDPTAPNTGRIVVSQAPFANFPVITYFHEERERVLWRNPLGHAGAGIIRLSTFVKVFDDPLLKEKGTFCFYREAMPKVVERGAAACITSGPFLEFGTAARYDGIMLRHPEWIKAAYDL
jgi:NDP-sugar pyrophosphorylase family protein